MIRDRFGALQGRAGEVTMREGQVWGGPLGSDLSYF
jgi:hypothetical protein